MEATAKLKYLRMSPRKVRLVADMIRGQKVEKAREILSFLNKRAAKPLGTLLDSAAANAGQKEGMETEFLYVSSVMVNEGPIMKRFMPRAMGRAYPIRKPTCHIELALKNKPKKVSKAVKAEEVTTEVTEEKVSKKKKAGKVNS
ncbi:MAG: 50S ribosomal protein L22 [uncultured bacterium]|nr:MAG: 50S ribosomal protein L22 [uncultured bacterium]